jgi:hypothetical protein
MKQFRGSWQRLPQLAKSRTAISALFVQSSDKTFLLTLSPPGDYSLQVVAFCSEYSVHRPDGAHFETPLRSSAPQAGVACEVSFYVIEMRI